MQHKKAFILLMIMVLAFASNLLTVGAQDNQNNSDSIATISVLPEVLQADQGQAFNVYVQVTGATGVYGADFKLSYDPQTFEVVNADDGTPVNIGSFFGDNPNFALQNTADTVAGNIDYALTLVKPAQPVSGDGIIGTIKFRALQGASTASITIADNEAHLATADFSQGTVQKTSAIPVQISQSPAIADASAGANSNTASVADSIPSAALADATALFNTNPALNNQAAVAAPKPESNGLASQLPMIIAGVFFVFGLILLTVSVGLYSRMRVRFNMMALNDIHPDQVF